MPRFALNRPGGVVTLAGIAALTALVVGAQPPQLDPTPAEQATAQIVATLLERGHISKPDLNDTIATHWAKSFIESLDPQKYNFLKGDVDEFMASADTLDDAVMEGDVSWSRTVFERFLKRSDERLAATLKILEQEPDFTIDESIVDDPDLIEYAATTAEAEDRLRQLLKFELLRRKVNGDTIEKAASQLAIRYKDLNRYFHNFDSGDLLERYLTELAESVDPHSGYMQPETLEDMLSQQLHLSLEGIGASLMIEDGLPVVKEVVPGGAADKDGRLQAEDKIVAVETEDGERDEFYGKKLSDIVRKIRGPAGTKVRIVIQPSGAKDLKTYELTREKIELTEQQAKGQVIEVPTEEGRKVHVGVLSLPSFYGDTQAVLNGDPEAVSATKDCRRLLEQFKQENVDAVVVDLRMNGGGLLQEAITLSGLFIDKGPVVQIREATGVKHLDDEEEGAVWEGPMAVIIDRTSASASEIFAGVIRDYDRGLILGDSSTYGKGTVQSIVPLNERLRIGRSIPNLGALKLTIQQFYRPNGDSTQVKGVVPHIRIPSFLDVQDIGEGKSDNALPFDEVAPVSHDMYTMVPKALVETLIERSTARRESDEKFKEQTGAIDRFLARRARHEISLNEEKFRAEMAAQELDEEEAKADEGADGAPKKREERKAWEPSFYNDEIMAIIADYVTLGGKILTAGPIKADQVTPEMLRP